MQIPTAPSLPSADPAADRVAQLQRELEQAQALLRALLGESPPPSATPVGSGQPELAREARRQALSRLGREIRTPINSVLGMAHLLLQTPLSAEQREMAQAIGDSAEALLTTVSAIVDVLTTGEDTADSGLARVNPAAASPLPSPPARVPEPVPAPPPAPLALAVPSSLQELSAAAGGPARDTAQGGLRLLLVEDNAINQALARALLQRMGHHVTTAAHGQEALQWLARQRFDAVFMDCQMPVMDGFEATRRIRAGLDGVLQPGIRIIAMTAHALRGDRERCFEVGMDDYVPKPIQVAVLREAVAAIAPAAGPAADAPAKGG